LTKRVKKNPAPEKAPEKKKKTKEKAVRETVRKDREQEDGTVRKGKVRPVREKSQPGLRPWQSTQKNLPIREVVEGIIITTDNRYIQVLEVMPVNFLLKSAAEQNSIIYSFRSLFKSGPASLQFKVISRKSDVRRHLDILQREMRAETSDNCLRMQREYAALLKRVGESEGVTRRFFLIYEFEKQNLVRKPSFAEILTYFATTNNRIRAILGECGNEVVEADALNEQTCEILYTVLNRKRSESEPFSSVIADVIGRYMAEQGTASLPYIPPTEYFAPGKIAYTSRRHVLVDGKYCCLAYIPSAGYNPRVYAGWTSPLINAGEGIDVDIFIERLPKDKVLGKIRLSLRLQSADALGTSSTQKSYEDLEKSISSGLYLKNGLAGAEEFFYFATVVSIYGDSADEVEWKFREFEKILMTMDIDIRVCLFEQEQAYLSTLPLCRLDASIWDKAKRNALTSDIASIYPFTSFELCDVDGILFGINQSNNSLAIVDIFNTAVYKNANLFIAGATGAGKTFSLLLLAMRMRLKHIPVFIIAPEKEHEFRRVCTAMGGQFIQFGAGSPNRINIMEIFKRDDSVTRLIDGEVIEASHLSEKVQDLKTFFKLLVPDISYEEKQLLDDALIATYRAKGITADNDSLADPDDPSRYRAMPVLEDLYRELLGNERTLRVANIIRMLVSGSGSSFNGQTNVDLGNDFVVLGLEHLSDELLPVGMFMAIDYIWSKIKEDRTRRKTLLIDEWWRFAFDPLAAEYSLKIAKTIRAYGGSLVLATQQMSDIFAIEGGKYGEGVLNNCMTKIIMQLEMQDALSVQKVMRLTESETMRITRFRRGTGLLVANSNSVVIRFKASETEFDLITTDRGKLEEQLNRRRQEAEIRELAADFREEDWIELIELEDLQPAEPEPLRGAI